MNIYYSTKGTQYKTAVVTPAHVYAGTPDMADILNDMEKGEFPVGTGEPFPVNFSEEGVPNIPAGCSPWTAHNTSLLQDPPQSMIVGPNAFNHGY